jgi:outer membrane protein
MHKLWPSVWTGILGIGLISASAQNPQNSQPPGSTKPAAGQSAQPPPTLTLAEAEAIALKNHPQVLAAQLTALASYQVVREIRSAYFPTLAGDVTGAAASPNTRIGAGFFTNPRILSRFAQGITVSQLITDSGRTPNLVQSSRLQARAEDENAQATRYDVLLRVGAAYFGALRAQVLVKVAQETVAARQVVVDQVTALAQSKLKSQLDVSFANVNLAEAKLLLIGAQDNLDKSFAEFSRALGLQQEQRYTLIEEPLPPPAPPDPNQLVQEALNQRPELLSERFTRDAAYKFEKAERDLSYPTVSLAGAAGFMPEVWNPTPTAPIANYFDAAVINVQIPVFNGHLFAARRAAATLKAQAEDQKLRDLEDSIARDVRSAWADSTTAYQRLSVTDQLLQQANLALDLAQSRYQLGLGSIVELSQAQLNQTQAAIEQASAKYEYQSQAALLEYQIGELH